MERGRSSFQRFTCAFTAGPHPVDSSANFVSPAGSRPVKTAQGDELCEL